MNDSAMESASSFGRNKRGPPYEWVGTLAGIRATTLPASPLRHTVTGSQVKRVLQRTLAAIIGSPILTVSCKVIENLETNHKVSSHDKFGISNQG